MNKIVNLLLSATAVACISGCAIGAQNPTPTAAPTQTAYPTYTPVSTQTPYPTYTPPPAPTSTQTPTPTKQPDLAVLNGYEFLNVDDLGDRHLNKRICYNDTDLYVETYNPNVAMGVMIGAKNLGTLVFPRDPSLESRLRQALSAPSAAEVEFCGILKSKSTLNFYGKDMTEYVLEGTFLVINDYPIKLPAFPPDASSDSA
jgi:hypothetical protein